MGSSQIETGGHSVPIRYIDFITCGWDVFYQNLKEQNNGKDFMVILHRLSIEQNCDIYGIRGVTKATGDIFYVVGEEAEAFTKAPRSIEAMFSNFGTCSLLPELKAIDVTGLDVRNAENFTSCFANVGRDSIDGVDIFGLETWQTSNAKNMRCMFCFYNEHAKYLDLNLEGFKTNQVRSLAKMFANAGRYSKQCNISGLEQWSLDSVEPNGVFGMFSYCGLKANHKIDCSNWKVNKKDFQNLAEIDFAKGVGAKIVPPQTHK